jgi:hypothetical protein
MIEEQKLHQSKENEAGNLSESKKEGKRVFVILLLVLLLATVSFFLPKAFSKNEGKRVRILKNGTVLIEKKLSADSKILIMDQEAKEVDFSLNLASLSVEEQNPAMHEVNFIEIKEGKVLCTESNCNNQICVRTPAISEQNSDLPIVCLPHGLIIQIITNS